MNNNAFIKDVFAKTRMSAGSSSGVEVFAEKSNDTTIVWSQGKLEDFYISESQGLGIKIIREGKTGFAYMNKFDGLAADGLISAALKNCESLQPDKFVSLAVPRKTPMCSELDICDNSFGKEPAVKKIDTIKKMEKFSLSNGRIKSVIRAIYSESLGETQIINTNGLELSCRGTVFSYGISCLSAEGSDTQVGGESSVTRLSAGLDFEKITAEAVKNAVELLGAKRIKTGNYPTVFNQNVACEFLSLLESSFSAFAVQKNVSMLKNRINEKVFSDTLNVVDDGTLHGGVATSSFDDEGTPTQGTVMVEKGVLKNYLYDLYTANKDGVKSTGNSSRGFSGVSRPSATNIFIQSGSLSPDVIIKQMNSGLLVTETMGMHNADAVSGEFSVGINGFFVENGVKKFPVHGITIAGNIFDLFKNIAAAGNDLRFYGSVGSPSLLVNGLRVSGE